MSGQSHSAGGDLPAAIGRYQVTGSLGFGAMGAVYKAFDPLIKRTLAIKTIRLDIPRNTPQHRAFIERFYQEARISGTLSHPSIVTLFDIGEESGVPFLAMEYVEGRTIAEVLERGERFKPEKVVALVSQVAGALDYAHSRGIVHRDIKPSNLILHEHEKVKVTDFGIAKLADSEITHSGALLGTPSYMSPEQAMGERLDGRSDIFSLGVCAFEMLSGLQPFPGANVTSILYKLVHVEPIEPADLETNGLVPQKWREVFSKVLAKKPENRYATAGAFVQDLEYCLGSWFTGLGEETVALASAAADETTATLHRPASVPVTLDGETLRMSAGSAPAARSAVGEIARTLVLEAAAAQEATVLLRAPGETDEPAPTVVLPPVGPAPVEPPPEAAQTLPPLATIEEAAAPTIIASAPLDAALAPTIAVRAPVEDGPPATVVAPAPAASAAPPRPGLPAGPLVAGVVAVLLVAAGVIGWALWQRSQRPGAATPPVAENLPPAAEPDQPAASALPTAGELRVDSEPAGARVQLNGEPRGETPLVLPELPFGEYEVRLERRGYEPQVLRSALSADSPAAALRATLVRAAAVTGTAEVVSTPPGAEVVVDGRPAGRTPLRALALRPGPRRLALSLDGHEPWSGTVDVVAGQKGRVDVKLRPLAPAAPPPAPEPVVEAVDPERVYGLQDVDSPPRKLSGSSPSYPSDRLKRLRSGERVSVTLRFVVTETGEVRDVVVVESGGRVLDDVVVAAIRGWKYEPATKRGTRVKSLVMFKQTFLGG